MQLVKKVVQSGDTACLQPTLDVFRHEDRQLLQGHCHARALAILQGAPSGAEGGAHTREAIAYLSLAIFSAGRSCPPTPRAPKLCQVHGGMGSLCNARARDLGDQGCAWFVCTPRGHPWGRGHLLGASCTEALAIQVNTLKPGR